MDIIDGSAMVNTCRMWRVEWRERREEMHSDGIKQKNYSYE